MEDALPVGEVHPAHRFDVAKLGAYLADRIDGFGDDLVVLQFHGGTSNPTFLLTTRTRSGPRRYVLRKKPPGPLLASAHQVDREYRVMKALEGHVPVPTMRHLCEDADVIGTAFYVMDFLPSRIFRDASLPGMTPKERTAIYDELNATLAKLHAVDFNAVGLGDYGRPGNFFARQIDRWTRQYRGAETEQIPEMEDLIRLLPGLAPPDEAVGIVHGDYRLENVMFHPTEPRLIAVLDWELSTIGNPMADVGYNGFLWHSHSPGWGSLDGVDFATSGIPSEADYVAAYCRRRGLQRIDHWAFYLAFAVFRLASISQGGYRRILNGVLATEGAPVNGTRPLAQQALAFIQA